MTLSRTLLATLLATAAFSPAFAATETYTMDAGHTNVIWHASHFGFSSSSGRFGITEGTLKLDEKNPAKSAINVTLDVAGLKTGIPVFDEHLLDAKFLDAAKYPTATFTSTKVDVTGANTAKVTGDFTLHGVTKPVVLDVTLNKIGPSPMSGIKTAGFSAKTVIKRSEFGIDAYVPNISDEVSIGIEAEANLADAAPAKK